MAQILRDDSPEPLSDIELRSLIARHLPAWQQACDANDGDSIVLHESSFGTSTHELFLFACAIKYAASKGKHVHVASGTGKTKHQPETALPSAKIGSVYREDRPVQTTRATGVPRKPVSKGAKRKQRPRRSS